MSLASISLGTNSSTPNGVLYNPDTDSLFVADTNSKHILHVIKNLTIAQLWYAKLCS